MKRTLPGLFAILAMLIQFPSLAATGTTAPGKPNILVIMGDDIGWMNVSSYGADIMGVATPNIDRIGREGLRLGAFYAQPSCTAGRAPSPPRLPLDRTADGRRLVGDDRVGRGDFPHRLHQLAPRAGGGRGGSALVEAAAIFQLAVRPIAEKIGGADGAVSPRDRLAFVVQIGEGEVVIFGENLHRVERIRRIGLRVIGADGGEAKPLLEQNPQRRLRPKYPKRKKSKWSVTASPCPSSNLPCWKC